MLPSMARPGWVRGGARRREHALELLDVVELADRATHRPMELSGGEQQRVALARALMNEPRLVLADEPTGNLDDETGEEIHGLIRTLSREQGRAFVVVTHKRGFARFADRLLLLSDGRLGPLDATGP